MSWAGDMRDVHAQAGGAMFLDVMQPGDLADLVGRAYCGSDRARRLISSIERALEGIAKAPRRTPMLCASCPAPIRAGGDFHLCIAAPARDTPRTA